ncbi:HpcH/HpaI aldolase/citrate lyase [Aureococcus anophagefferens]|nr:HpcH/HpaI aldolase/citrate lyase [Aureococcus anophagefferens]
MHAMLRYASRAVVGVGASTLATTAFADGKEPPLSYRPPFVAPQSTNAAWVQSMKEGKAMMGCAVNSSSSLACHAGGAKAFVRVGGHNDRVGIQQACDLGADGARAARAPRRPTPSSVSCCKYPMSGRGSVGGTRSVFVNLRPQLPGGFGKLFDYVHNGNPTVVVAVQIETKDALENVEEICSVDGLDIAFIGPGDLAVDMGLGRECGVPACWGDPRGRRQGDAREEPGRLQEKRQAALAGLAK